MARPREHEFICRDEPGVQEIIVIEAPLGTSPEPPVCEKCGKAMTKLWGTPQINYVRKWRISMGR